MYTKDSFPVCSGSAACNGIHCPAICEQRNPIKEPNDSYVSFTFQFAFCWLCSSLTVHLLLTDRNELPVNQVTRNIPHKVVAQRNIVQHTQQKGKVIQRTDLKQMVANKLPPQKMR
jgi:hypothetical protein